MSLSRLLLRLVLGRRLPITSGELRIPGPSSPITIRRDKWGVPHIDAGNDPDVWFGLGFCHGQDRAGQLELLWRVGRGRLAEWVGNEGVAIDRVSRRIGFWRSSETQFPVLGSAEQGIITAYVRGVNAGTATGLPKRPHEFAILGGEPSRWEPPDVLALLKLQTFLIPSNWDVELARLRILLADGPDAVRELDPTTPFRRDPKGSGFTSWLNGVTDALAADLAALQAVLPRGGGSNNWAIAGSRTASGKPLLASDPHLAPGIPAPWYLAHVRTPQWEILGAGIAGTPGFSIGHNGFAAWGVTAGLTDTSDLFVETLGPDGASVREADGSFTPCQRLREVIRVKKAADVVEDVLVAPRGPLLTAADTGLPVALSLRAVWLDPLPLSGFLCAPRARSFEEFRRCFAAWPALPLNVVYADAGGTIGWQLAGQVPQRRGGHGLLPRPADAPDTGWAAEHVPFDHMPFVMNPECGFVATANDPPQESGVRSQGSERSGHLDLDSLTPHPSPLAPSLGADFIDPFRATVIRDELAKRVAWDIAGCAELQRSTRSLPWELMSDIVLSLEPADPDARDAIALLREWDGRVDTDCPAAAVYELFVAELCVRVAKAKAPNAWAAALGETGLGTDGHNLFSDRRVGHLVRLLRDRPANWFKRPWPEELLDALGGVVRRLRREVGPGPAYWAWGHLRQLRLAHPLFGQSWLLGPVFNLGPVPVGGDQNTVSQAGCRPAHPSAFTHNIAGLRAVFDLADLSRSVFVLCGGQSGNPCSPHFADQFPLWQAGETIPIAWEQPRVIREAKEALRLLPATPPLEATRPG